MTKVPPLRITMCRLWLPPKVWLHGNQSTTTGFSCARKRHALASISWLAHSMRCVLITTLGEPVDPEVNRYLATVSGVMRSKACITADVSGVAARDSKASAPGTSAAPRLSITGMFKPAARAARIAGP